MREGDDRPVQGTQALARSFDILRIVAQLQRVGATLAAITRASGLSRTTAFRIVHFLTEERLLEYDAGAGHYFIGPFAFELGLAAKGPTDLIARWQPRLEELSRRTGMTAYLMARSDAEAVCVAKVEGRSILRAVPLQLGQRLPLGVGAGSLALLSALDDDAVHSAIAVNRTKLNFLGDGHLTPDVLWQRVKSARSRGYAISENTVAKGVIGLGRVITDSDSLLQWAISVSAPSSELKQDQYDAIAKLVQEIARTA